MSRPNFYESAYQPTRRSSFSRVPSNGARPQMYTLTERVPYSDQSLHESLLSKDIDSIEESTLVSASAFNVYDHTSEKPMPRMPPKHYVNRENVRLPPIGRPRQEPEVYHYVQSKYEPDYVHHPPTVRYRASNHYRPRQYRHGETHDPRWWYMPINSVHGPKSRRLFIDHRQHYYSPPKWYQLPDRR